MARKGFEAIDELLKTEQDFFNHMQSMVSAYEKNHSKLSLDKTEKQELEYFMQPYKVLLKHKPIVIPEDVSDEEAIAILHKQFSGDDSEHAKVMNLLKICTVDQFDLIAFISRVGDRKANIFHLFKTDNNSDIFNSWVVKDKLSTSIQSYMIRTVQQGPRYKLLLKEILQQARTKELGNELITKLQVSIRNTSLKLIEMNEAARNHEVRKPAPTPPPEKRERIGSFDKLIGKLSMFKKKEKPPPVKKRRVYSDTEVIKQRAKELAEEAKKHMFPKKKGPR